MLSLNMLFNTFEYCFTTYSFFFTTTTYILFSNLKNVFSITKEVKIYLQSHNMGPNHSQIIHKVKLWIQF